MQERRQPEIIAGRVNADGSISAGDGFTVTKGTTGIYTINFPSSFRLQSLTATPLANGLAVGQNNTPGQVFIFTLASAASDNAFTFTAVGVQQ